MVKDDAYLLPLPRQLDGHRTSVKSRAEQRLQCIKLGEDTYHLVYHPGGKSNVSPGQLLLW
ncbi:MAG: hypothetical protein SWZ49_12980 [Cyanobacteriota bacterium]|nr:hypothetical protein [Cyanobacteriota bacterium]